MSWASDLAVGGSLWTCCKSKREAVKGQSGSLSTSLLSDLFGVFREPSLDGFEGLDDIGGVPELLDGAAVLLGEHGHLAAVLGASGEGGTVRGRP